ncbi:MAG: hypothetical protein OQL28_02840 [Sedimenticola sp.]|nr:hypothetical protein [Sedimenticola sp.]
MRNLIVLLICLLTAGPLLASGSITPPEAPIIVYQAEDDYEAVKSNLEIAITGRGMVISSMLHISDMFQRTAQDTGLPNTLYDQAEAFEFCSIRLSHQMSAAHPANLSICPLVIGIYTLQEEPGMVYVSYRRPSMLGDAGAAEQALLDLYKGIVTESIE